MTRISSNMETGIESLGANLSEVRNVIPENTHQSVYHSEKAYYEYLSDMKSDNDNCDYCTAFMFV